MNGFLTVKEVSELWGIGERRIQILCKEGVIKNTTRIGRNWLIPEDTKRPVDQRIKTGEWRNYRNKKEGLE